MIIRLSLVILQHSDKKRTFPQRIVTLLLLLLFPLFLFFQKQRGRGFGPFLEEGQ